MLPVIALTLSGAGLALAVAATVLAIILVGGIVAGQFRRGVVSELRESLGTANDEIAIERGRSDRLEREAGLLRAEVVQLRSEVATLRNVIVNEQEIAKSVAEALRHETALRTQEAVDQIIHAVAAGTSGIFQKLEKAADKAVTTHEMVKAIDNAVNQKKPGSQTMAEEVSDLHSDRKNRGS